jgi:transcriptional regulator with XRE-family HTH domain
MLYVNRIKELIDNNNLTIKGFAEKIGVSEPGIHNMFRQNDMKISTLQKIADYFHVPITYFLDDIDSQNQTVDLIFDTLKKIVKEQINAQ